MAAGDTHDRQTTSGKPEHVTVVGGDSTGVPEGVSLREELYRTAELVRQLNSVQNSLPHLTEESFIWPETEDQYAGKEELQSELTGQVRRLLGYMPTLQSRIRRYRHNLERIEADSARLNHNEPIEHYEQAQESQRRRYIEAVYDKDSASIVLAEAQAVLNVARKKPFPGRKPVRQYPFKGAKLGDLPPGPMTSDPQAPGNGSGGDLDDLISLGPLGQIEGTRAGRTSGAV